jgi:hypothetical protein
MMAESDEYDSESEPEIDEIKPKRHGIFDVNADGFMN